MPEPPRADRHPGSRTSDDAIFGKPQHGARGEAGMLPRCRGGPRPARTALSPAARPPGWGGLCSGGDLAWSSRSGRAVPALRGAPEHAGQAGRAWRAGCDVNPGGGGVGPGPLVPGLAHAPLPAKPINTLFPASKSFSKPGSGPQSRSPASRAMQPSRRRRSHRWLPGQASPEGRTCRAWVNFPALPVAGWSILACRRRPPPTARPRVCSHDSSTAKPAPGQVMSEEADGPSLG